MLFNSAEFLFLFLPVTLFVYMLLVERWHEGAIWWLIAASIVFYGAWNVAFVPLLIGSVSGNYLIGRLLGYAPARFARRSLLVIGVAGNLALLGYFKYTNFFFDTIAAMGITLDPWERIVLPIGLSFFTFQQIAFLVDSYRQDSSENSFSRYALFVIFFPHLIAGPITHHREIIPQFDKPPTNRSFDLAAGITLLAIGLFKKIIIADTVAIPSSAIFDAAATGRAPTMLEAWMAISCYTLQIYFDFSAYSDMAVALARMFGINFPINFASPYKAASITDFWRRWHITLSRFLRDYLYFPLGGNRRGPLRQKLNLMITMLLGGLWHGAGWNFVLWGALHGFYLLVNHAWAESLIARRINKIQAWPAIASGLTLLCVMVAWVPFRANDFATAISVWRGMFGLNGLALPAKLAHKIGMSNNAVPPLENVSLGMTCLVLILFIGARLMPNSYEIMSAAKMGTETHGYPATIISPQEPIVWRQTLGWALVITILLFVSVMKLHDISEFIYFQF